MLRHSRCYHFFLSFSSSSHYVLIFYGLLLSFPHSFPSSPLTFPVSVVFALFASFRLTSLLTLALIFFILLTLFHRPFFASSSLPFIPSSVSTLDPCHTHFRPLLFPFTTSSSPSPAFPSSFLPPLLSSPCLRLATVPAY